MGREIRRVPPGWDHPRYSDDYGPPRAGRYKPLFDNDYEKVCQEWINGALEAKAQGKTYREYAEYEGPGPDPELYRETWTSEPTAYQVYETVSEGTPTSPVFETRDEMKRWLIGQGHSETAAESFISSGYAPSMVVISGGPDEAGIYSGIDSHDIRPKED